MMQLSLSLRLGDLGHEPNLLRHVPERIPDSLVALVPAVQLVLQSPLLRKRPDEAVAHVAQVVARHAREEVVRDLHVQPTVQKVQKRRARYVHCGANLTRGERLVQPQVGRRLREVREDDLRGASVSVERNE